MPNETEQADQAAPQLPAIARAPKPPIRAGARPLAIVPESFEDCHRIATAVYAAGMLPQGIDTQAKALIAIMQGLEVGLTPMAAMQRIAVINGRPTLWGDAVLGLCLSSGLLEDFEEITEGEGDSLAAVCRAKRKGLATPIVRRFSHADAKRAGLLGKKGPWQDYPTRMMQMRARAYCLRDGFADVLGGMYVREEIEDEARAGEPEAAPDPNKVARVSEPPPPPPAPAIEHKPPVAIEPIVGTAQAEQVEAAAPAEPVKRPRGRPPKVRDSGVTGLPPTNPPPREDGSPPMPYLPEAAPIAADAPPPPPPGPSPEQDAAAEQAKNEKLAALYNKLAEREGSPPIAASAPPPPPPADDFPGDRPSAQASPYKDAAEQLTLKGRLHRFAIEAERCADEDALNESWERVIGPYLSEFTPDQRDAAGEIHGRAVRRITEGEA